MEEAHARVPALPEMPSIMASNIPNHNNNDDDSTSTGENVVDAVDAVIHDDTGDNPEEDFSSTPFFTDEEERREKQEMTSDEIIDIESDLRGITTEMDGMSIAAAGGGSSTGVGGLASGQNASQLLLPQQQIQQQSSSWRDDDEIQRDLTLLDEEIQKMPIEDKAAYLEAVQRCPDEAFGGWRWEVFLEQRCFDAKRTAKHLTQYWKRRLALFGEDRCYLPMTLTGAMQDEVAGMVAYDVNRISPVKDTAGRTVVVCNPDRRVRSLYTTKSQSRAFWYDIEVIAQDPEARSCGTVMLINGSKDHPRYWDPRFARFALSSIDLFPFSWNALHFLNTNIISYRIIIPAAKFLFGRRLRHRVIVHTGTSIGEMRTYALPPDRLPKEFGGEVVVDMQAWISERYAKEGLNLVGDPVVDMEQNVERNVEPSTKRIRRELSPDVPDEFGHASSAVQSSSPGRQSRTQQPVGRREPSPSTSMSGIEMTDEERILLGDKPGRKSDPRMNTAIILKLRTPDMDNFDALIAAGFNYPLSKDNDKRETETFDKEGVSLRQRKNQLNRRVRKLRPKYERMVVRKRNEMEHLVQQPVTDERKPSAVTERADSQEHDSQEDPSSGNKVSHDMSSSYDEQHAVEASRQGKTMSDASKDSFYDRILELPGLDGL